jgi:hypothetical protein
MLAPLLAPTSRFAAWPTVHHLGKWTEELSLCSLVFREAGGHAHAHQALPMLDAVAAGSANASTRASGPRARQVACALAHLHLLTEILFRSLAPFLLCACA